MIRQGSNIPIALTFKPLPAMASLEVSMIKNGNEVKHWNLDDVKIDGDTVLLPLSQNDTLGFPAGAYDLEIKYLDQNGSAIPLCIQKVVVSNRTDKTIMGDGDYTADGIYSADIIIDTESGTVVYKGFSPYIGENGNWFEFNYETGEFKDTGVKAQGEKGDDGLSSYEIAKANGFIGTEAEWLESLKGRDGSDAAVTKENIQKALGFSPYQKPATGIPEADLSQEVKTKLNQHGGGGLDAYTKQESDDRYVEKEDGKALSSNDYSNEDKEKVDNLPTDTNDEIRKLDEAKISKPTDAPTVGKILKVKSVNEDGSFVVEWGDAPQGGVEDVKIDNKSIVSDSIANIPRASHTERGLVLINGNYGLGFATSSEILTMYTYNTWEGFPHGNMYRPIVPSTFYHALQNVMGSPIGTKGLINGVYHYPAWTPEEQANAQIRLGIYPMNEEGY